MKRKQVGFRITEKQDEMLNELSTITGMTRNDILINWIETEHDKIKGNPKLLAVLEQMKELQKKLQSFGDEKE